MKYEDLVNDNNGNDKEEIIFRGHRGNNKLYNSTEINDINQYIYNFNYKNELLNEINSLLNDGIKKENIYVLSDSVSTSNQYSRYGKDGIIDLKNDVIKWYNLGFPISLKADPINMIINTLFYLYQNAYSFFNNRVVKSGKDFFNTNVPNKRDTLEYLYESAINLKSNMISGGKYNNIVKNILKKEILSSNNHIEIIDSVINNWFESEKGYFNKIKSICDILYKNNLTNTSFENILKKENISFTKFESVFNRNSRPIICVYDNNHIRIICFDMIARKYFSHDNYRFLETRSIRQNSPLCIILGISFMGLLGISEVIKYRLLLKKQKIDNISIREQAENDIKKDNSYELNRLSEKKSKLASEISEMKAEFNRMQSSGNITSDSFDNYETTKKLRKSMIININNKLDSNNIEINYYNDSKIN